MGAPQLKHLMGNNIPVQLILNGRIKIGAHASWPSAQPIFIWDVRE